MIDLFSVCQNPALISGLCGVLMLTLPVVAQTVRTSPLHEATLVAPLTFFEWPAVEGATGYRIRLAKSPAGIDLESAIRGTVTTNRWEVDEPLTPGFRYFWQIEVVFPATSVASPVWRFDLTYQEHPAVGGRISGGAASVVLGDDQLIVGGSQQVNFFRFDRPGGQLTLFDSDVRGDDSFPWQGQVALDGFSVLSGRTFLVSGQYQREVQVFDVGNGRAELSSFLPRAAASRSFGTSLAAGGGIAFVASSGGETAAGKVDVFHRWPEWHLVQSFRSPLAGNNDNFGYSMVIDGNRAIIGSPRIDGTSTHQARAFIYERSPLDGQWNPVATLEPLPSSQTWVEFGRGVALSGDRAAVAYFDGESSGVAIYTRQGDGTWSRDLDIPRPPDVELSAGFGYSISLQDDLLVIGAYGARNIGGGGRVYPHRFENGRWISQETISPRQTERNFNGFGASVDLRDGWLAVGQFGNFDETIHAWVYHMEGVPDARPRLTGPPPSQAVQGRPLRVEVPVEDPEGKPLELTLASGPEWLSIEKGERGDSFLAGTPPSVGPQTLQLQASDGVRRAWFTFRIDVVGTGEAPVLEPLPERVVLREGQDHELLAPAQGREPMIWEFSKDGQTIQSSAASSVHLRQVDSEDSGRYQVRVTNVVGADESSPIEVVVEPADRFGGNWPTLGGGSARRGHHPATLGEHRFVQAWERPLAARGVNTVLSHPIIADGTVFTTISGNTDVNAIHALDLQTGLSRWNQSFRSSSTIGGPTWHEGAVYFQRSMIGNSRPFELLAYSATGTALWRAPYESQHFLFHGPAIGPEGIFMAGGQHGGLYGFNFDGSRRFFDDLDQVDHWTPVLSDGRLFTYMYGQLREHDTVTGSVLWGIDRQSSWEHPASYRVDTTPAIAGDHCLIHTWGRLLCVDLDDRAEIWSHPAEELFNGHPSIFRDRGFVIDGNRVRSFRLSDGSELTSYERGSRPHVLSESQPLIVNDHLIASTAEETLVFELESGALRQTLPGGGRTAYSDGYLISAGSDGILRGFFANAAPVAANDGPVSLNAGPAALATTVNLRDLIVDPDPDDPLTWTLAGVSNPDILRDLQLDSDGQTLDLDFNPWISGESVLTLVANDSAGNSAEATLVISLPELPQPELEVESQLVLNRQTGLFEQTIKVTNPAAREIAGFDLTIDGLPEGVSVHNSSGGSGGSWQVHHRRPLAAAGTVTLVLEYFAPGRGAFAAPDLSLTRVAAPASEPTASVPGLAVERIERLPDGSLLLEFNATPGRTYEIQYSDDAVDWKISSVSVRAAGNRVQWIDRGPPRTHSPPSDSRSRFYRVREIQEPLLPEPP